MSVRPPPPLPPAPETPTCSDLERLHDDCRRGHTSNIREAIGADRSLVNQQGNLGFTALQWAAQTGHVDVVELLLHEGAQVNAVNHQGDTALHLAVWKKHALVVAVLLGEQWGVDLELRNHEGKRAEDLARTEEIRELFVKQACAAHPIHMAPPEEDDDDDDD